MNRTIALPEDLLNRAEVLAAKEHLSLEVFVTAKLSQRFDGLEYLSARAARASREEFEAALHLVPDVDPEEYDRL